MKKVKAKGNVKANAKAKVTYAPFEVPADILAAWNRRTIGINANVALG